MKTGTVISRWAAVSLGLALVQTSFSPAAWAQVERISGEAAVSSAGSMSAAAGAARFAPVQAALQVQTLSLTPVFAQPQAISASALPGAAAVPFAAAASRPVDPAVEPVAAAAQPPAAAPATPAAPQSGIGAAISRAAGGFSAVFKRGDAGRTRAAQDSIVGEDLDRLYENSSDRARPSDGAPAVESAESPTPGRASLARSTPGSELPEPGKPEPRKPLEISLSRLGRTIFHGLLVERSTFGDKAADALANAVGSWTFIVGQSVFLGLWAVLNGVSFVYHWDPYPFILMNLGLSMQAAYTGPVLLMSQNRQDARDRLEAHNNHIVNREAEAGIRAILAHFASTGDPAITALIEANRADTADSAGVKNVHERLHETRTLGQRVADGTARVIGSWRFIIIMTAFLAAWAALNVTAFVGHWDPYPFVFMNLVLSMQAAYTGPVLMMSHNRESIRDRIAARSDSAVNIKAAEEIRAIVQHLAASRAGSGPAGRK